MILIAFLGSLTPKIGRIVKFSGSHRPPGQNYGPDKKLVKIQWPPSFWPVLVSFDQKWPSTGRNRKMVITFATGRVSMQTDHLKKAEYVYLTRLSHLNRPKTPFWPLLGPIFVRPGPQGPKNRNFQKFQKWSKFFKNFVPDLFCVFWPGELRGTSQSAKLAIFVEIWPF